MPGPSRGVASPRGAVGSEPLGRSVRRSLRIQLVFMVIVTVTILLGLSQWLDGALSDIVLEGDLKDHGLLAARVVDSLWDRQDWSLLGTMLVALVQSHRHISAVDVFHVAGDWSELTTTTRGNGPAQAIALSPAEIEAIAHHGRVDEPLRSAEGVELRRLEVPIRRGDATVGIVRTDVSLASADALRARLRTVDFAVLALSTALISLTLGVFLRRRVGRPVTQLIETMRQAESGVLSARVPRQRSDEFDYLAQSFNRMLERIEELTSGLESRVRQATVDLAARNRELEAANVGLRTAQLEAARSERWAALGQMAATLAHELGTPLNSILGYTQLLRRAQLAPEHDSKLKILESQVQRMVETIRSLLDRTRAGTTPRAPVAIAPLVTEALEMVAGRLQGRDIVARCELPDDLPEIAADRTGLRQLLVNLLTNAIDAIEPPGEVTVHAEILNGKGPERRLELAVSDDGMGMEEEQLRHIFEPLYTTKSPGRGTGLGLAIVERVAREHGGVIAVESELGHGTTVRVRLPLEPA